MSPKLHSEPLLGIFSFDLTNAAATLQATPNSIFRGQTGKFVFDYLDDILSCSQSPEGHARHPRMVIHTLRHNELYGKLPKCEYNRPDL